MKNFFLTSDYYPFTRKKKIVWIVLRSYSLMKLIKHSLKLIWNQVKSEFEVISTSNFSKSQI